MVSILGVIVAHKDFGLAMSDEVHVETNLALAIYKGTRWVL